MVGWKPVQESGQPADNKEVISLLGGFFNFFGKEIRHVIE
jgi:hypothetical protein